MIGQAGVPLILFVLMWLLAIVGLLVAGPVERRWPRAGLPVRGGVVVCSLAGLGLAIYALVGQPGAQTGGDGGNPVAATEESIAAGAQLFEANCAACHGADARGGGPQAGTTPVRPPSLISHGDDHSDAELFAVLSDGLPGGMPAWRDLVSETDRWHLVNYIRSLQTPAEEEPDDHDGH